MRGWVCRSVFLLVLSVLPCVSAWAQPSAATSTTPACITLVGSNGVPDPAGTFIVEVRNAFNIPMPGVAVIVELINVNDVQLCPIQPAGQTVTCTPLIARRVCALTNGLGVATFIVFGHAFGPASSQGPLGEIWANPTASCVLGGGSVLLANTSVQVLDLDGGGGVGANDFSVWLADFASGDPWSRSDFDCTGNVGANDLSIWLALWGAGGSVVTCGPGC